MFGSPPSLLVGPKCASTSVPAVGYSACAAGQLPPPLTCLSLVSFHFLLIVSFTPVIIVTKDV